MVRGKTVIALAAVAMVVPALAYAQTRVELGLGAFNAVDQREVPPQAETSIEVFRSLVGGLGLASGLQLDALGSTYGYVSPYWDWQLAPGWRVTPQAGIGWYRQGPKGKDLGSPMEFRLALEISRELTGGKSLGLEFVHLSNAYTGRVNPGDEELLATFGVQF